MLFATANPSLTFAQQLAALGTVMTHFGPDAGVHTSGANVTSIDNQGNTGLLASISGVGHTPTYSATAINGKPGIVYSGANQYLTGAFASSQAQPQTRFCVMKITGAGVEFVLDSPHATDRHQVYHDGSNQTLAVNAGTGWVGAAAAYVAGTPFLAEYVINGVSSEIRVNGNVIASGNAGANTWGGIIHGADQGLFTFLTGAIGDDVVYAGVLGASARAAARELMRAKYALY